MSTIKQYYIFNSEPGVNILGLDPIIKSFYGPEFKKFAGKNLTNGIFYELNEGTFRAGAKIKEWNDLATHLLAKIKDPKFEAQMIKQIKYYGREIDQLCDQALSDSKNKNLTLATRKKIITKLFSLVQVICEYGLIVPIIDISNGALSKEVEAAVRSKVSDPVQAVEYLGLLTYRYAKNLDYQEEKDLIELANTIYKNKNLKKLFSKGTIKVEQVPPAVKKRIDKFIADWGWAHYSYCGPEYTAQAVVSSIVGILSIDKFPLDYLRHLDNDISVNRKKQLQTLLKLNFSSAEKYLFKVAQDVSETKSLRTKMMFKACFTINELLKPFLIMEGLTFKQFGVCTVDEVLRYFKTGKLPAVSVLNQRLNYCILFSSSTGEKFLVGQVAKQWFDQNVAVETVKKNLKELTGQIAYSSKSKVYGTVKLINTTADMKKFNPGDILVSIATTPEIVPVMKKASAILTDIGGMTCHAAIVSRELKIPCIVGLKVATRLLKDGDKVEIDTVYGIVKKI